MMLMIMTMTMTMVMTNVVASSWHIAMHFTIKQNSPAPGWLPTDSQGAENEQDQTGVRDLWPTQRWTERKHIPFLPFFCYFNALLYSCLRLFGVDLNAAFFITNILRLLGADLNVAWYASPYQSYKGLMRIWYTWVVSRKACRERGIVLYSIFVTYIGYSTFIEYSTHFLYFSWSILPSWSHKRMMCLW